MPEQVQIRVDEAHRSIFRVQRYRCTCGRIWADRVQRERNAIAYKRAHIEYRPLW